MFFRPITTKGFKGGPFTCQPFECSEGYGNSYAQARAMESPSILKVSQQSKSSKERVDERSANKNVQKEQNDGGRKECFNCGVSGHIPTAENLFQHRVLIVGNAAITMQGSAKQQQK